MRAKRGEGREGREWGHGRGETELLGQGERDEQLSEGSDKEELG